MEKQHGIVKWPICFSIITAKSDLLYVFQITSISSGWKKKWMRRRVSGWFLIFNCFSIWGCRKVAKRAKNNPVLSFFIIRKLKFAVTKIQFYLWAENQLQVWSKIEVYPSFYLYLPSSHEFAIRYRGSKLLEGLKGWMLYFWQQTTLGTSNWVLKGEQKAADYLVEEFQEVRFWAKRNRMVFSSLLTVSKSPIRMKKQFIGTDGEGVTRKKCHRIYWYKSRIRS